MRVHRTKIDWADFTWNPVWGCRGTCAYCYARRAAQRFGLQVAGREDFAPTWIEHNFQRRMPRKPARIFVNSMSDVAWWEEDWSRKVVARIAAYPEHHFLFLTKYPERLRQDLPPNAWYGFSCTDQESYLSASFQVADGTLQFLSIEPLLDELDLEEMICGPLLRWVIVGAETGNRHDRIIPRVAWLYEIYAFCRRHQIPLFFKDSLRHLLPPAFVMPREYPAGMPPE